MLTIAASVLSVSLLSIVGLLSYVIRQLGTHSEKFIRLEVILTGANGDNGMNSRIKQLGADNEASERRHTETRLWRQNIEGWCDDMSDWRTRLDPSYQDRRHSGGRRYYDSNAKGDDSN